MRPGRQPISSRSRYAALLIPSLSLLLVGCVHPRFDMEEFRCSQYNIRFDSSTNLIGIPRSAYDTTTHVLADVVEIMGRVIDVKGDSLLVAPSYVLISDSEHPGRTIRRGGLRALPDDLVVVVGPGDRIEPVYKEQSWLRPLAKFLSILLIDFLVIRNRLR